MAYPPLPSVTTVRVNPVSVCVTVTVTPGSTAPLSSLTVPVIWAVACAQAVAPATRISAHTAKDLNRITILLRLTERRSTPKSDRDERTRGYGGYEVSSAL